MSSHINRDIARAAPAKGFHRIVDAPFLPPSAQAAELICKKLILEYNGDLEDDLLPALARHLLPQQPFGHARLPPEELRAEIIYWHKQLTTFSKGAPDGTGLRTPHLLCLSSALPLLAQWLTALYRLKITPAHATLLRTKALGGQLKQITEGQRKGEYPSHM